MTHRLKRAHREAIVAVIAGNERVKRAVLFGSRATGTNTMSSDVDIALFGDELTLADQACLAAELEKIPMAQSVDLLRYATIRDRALRAHILREGVEWYARASPEVASGGERAMRADTPPVFPHVTGLRDKNGVEDHGVYEGNRIRTRLESGKWSYSINRERFVAVDGNHRSDAVRVAMDAINFKCGRLCE